MRALWAHHATTMEIVLHLLPTTRNLLVAVMLGGKVPLVTRMAAVLHLVKMVVLASQVIQMLTSTLVNVRIHGKVFFDFNHL